MNLCPNGAGSQAALLSGLGHPATQATADNPRPLPPPPHHQPIRAWSERLPLDETEPLRPDPPAQMSKLQCRLEVGDTAGWKPALRGQGLHGGFNRTLRIFSCSSFLIRISSFLAFLTFLLGPSLVAADKNGVSPSKISVPKARLHRGPRRIVPTHPQHWHRQIRYRSQAPARHRRARPRPQAGL